VISEKPRGFPVSSSRGVTMMWAQNCDPFLRVSPLGRGELELHSGIPPGGVIGREKTGVVLADDLFGAVSLDALGSEVPAGDVAVHVQNVDRVIADVLHHHAEPLLARAHLLFGQLPLGDVLADADHPHRPARRVAVHACLIVHRPDDPVRAHDAELVFVLGAAAQRLVRYPRRALPVLRMDERVEAVETRRHLIVADAEDPGELVRPPARVGPHVPFPAAEIGEDLRLLELNVACPQGLVLPPPLRDVARDRDDMRDTALRIEHGAAVALDPAHLSARKEKTELHVPVLAVADRVGERLLDPFLVLGVNLMKRIGP
jgi:hypothetical protein